MALDQQNTAVRLVAPLTQGWRARRRTGRAVAPEASSEEPLRNVAIRLSEAQDTGRRGGSGREARLSAKPTTPWNAHGRNRTLTSNNRDTDRADLDGASD